MATAASYAARAKRYAQSVVEGRISACRAVRLACERFLDDLESERIGRRWKFSAKHAAAVCSFIERLVHLKGPLAGEQFRLLPWETFALANVFGWVDRHGNRRYRKAYIEVPRGNGKSTLSAAVGLYMLCADGEPGAECYSFATTRQQARIVWEAARDMARRAPGLAKAYGLAIEEHRLYIRSESAKFEARSSEAGTLEGLNTHFACIDELHAHPTRELYDVVETSTGKRKNSLVWIITTAGDNLSGICYEMHELAMHVLRGDVQDDTLFALIYSIDPEDDWTSEAALEKANPSWGESVQQDRVLALRQQAMVMPSAAASYRRYHLNQWVQMGEAWLDLARWEECRDEAGPEAFFGEPCWIGMDLAEKTDLSSICLLFRRRGDDGKLRYHAYWRHYLPRETIDRGENAHYRGWEAQGRIRCAGQAATDYEFILRDLEELRAQYQVQAVLYDPAYAAQLVLRLEERGFQCVAVRPTVVNFSDPMKTVEAMVLERTLRHDGDPVARWAAANVIARRNASGGMYPGKRRDRDKIDPIVALLMAVAMASKAQETPAASVYETAGILWL